MLLNPNAVVDTVYHSDWGRIVATLIRFFGDFDIAEEAAQDAFAAAVDQWRTDGVPEFPRAWIIQTARHKAIDRIRRQNRFKEKLETYAGLSPTVEEPDYDTNEIPDDRLRLIFTCCHPALALESQVALTLRTLGGLETDEIARAFLVPAATMAQRLGAGEGGGRAGGYDGAAARAGEAEDSRRRHSLCRARDERHAGAARRGPDCDLPRLQRRLRAHPRHAACKNGPLGGGDPPGPPRESVDVATADGGDGARRPHAPARFAARCSCKRDRRSRCSRRAGPPAVESTADRRSVAVGRRGARRRTRSLRAAGGNRGAPLSGGPRRRNGLAADHPPLRCARAGAALAHRVAEPRSGDRHGGRACARAPARRRAGRGRRF